MFATVEFTIKGIEAPPEIETLLTSLAQNARNAGCPLQASAGATAWNVLAVAVGSGGAVTVAARAIAAWAAHRRGCARSDLHVEVRDPDGVTLVIDVTDTDAVERVLTQALNAVGRAPKHVRRNR